MEVTAAQTHCFIPPQFAAWIPAKVRHSIRMPGAVSMRTLYLRPGLARDERCAVLHVAPLLRELIVEAVRLGKLKTRDKSDTAFRDVLVAQIERASPIPTMLAMPKDSRARALAQSLLASPAGRSVERAMPENSESVLEPCSACFVVKSVSTLRPGGARRA